MICIIYLVLPIMTSSLTSRCLVDVHTGSASEHFQTRMYETSIRLFEASMLYIVPDSEGCMLEAKSLRVLCLCHMALCQFERAAEVVDAADKVKNLMEAGLSNICRMCRGIFQIICIHHLHFYQRQRPRLLVMWTGKFLGITTCFATTKRT